MSKIAKAYSTSTSIMPFMTYEYVCTECNHRWELEQGIKDAEHRTCPQCHQETAHRLISGGSGFILKGGGWGADLYSKPAT